MYFFTIKIDIVRGYMDLWILRYNTIYIHLFVVRYSGLYSLIYFDHVEEYMLNMFLKLDTLKILKINSLSTYKTIIAHA